MEKRTRDPSKGGIGIILNTARTRLIMTMVDEIAINPGFAIPNSPEKRMRSPKKIAREKFTIDPDAATRGSLIFG